MPWLAQCRIRYTDGISDRTDFAVLLYPANSCAITFTVPRIPYITQESLPLSVELVSMLQYLYLTGHFDFNPHPKFVRFLLNCSPRNSTKNLLRLQRKNLLRFERCTRASILPEVGSLHILFQESCSSDFPCDVRQPSPW